MASDPHWNKVVLALKCDGTNGSTTFTDSALNPKTVTANGNAQISTAQSQFGGASAYFDGTGDYLSVASSADFGFGTGSFTIECWFYTAATSGQLGLFSTGPQNSSAPFGIALYIEPGNNIIRARYGWNTHGYSWSVGSITGGFKHVALVRESGVVGLRLFLDGVLQTSIVQDGSGVTASVDFTNTTAVVGGNFPANTTNVFNGYIDELRVTKGVARYTANFTPPTAAFPTQLPVVSGTVKDASGNNAQRLVRVLDRKTCSLLNAGLSSASTGAYSLSVATADEVIVMAHDTADADPYWNSVVLAMHMNGANNATYFRDEKGKVVTPSGDAKISTTQSKFGGASAYFDGTGDYLSVASSADFDFGTTGDFTVEAFVYIAANSSLDASNRRFAHILAIDNGTAETFSFYVLGDASTTGTGLGLWNGNYSASAAVTVSQSAWHHVAVTRYAGSLRFFLNGTQVGSTTTFAYQLGGAAHAPKIGGRAWGTNYYYYLNGYIDDLRITKGVARYTANFTAPTAAFPDSLNGGTENAVIFDRVTPV